MAQFLSRRWLVGGAAAAGVSGLAAAAYKAAPSFWRQYAREFGRPIDPAPLRPNIAAWSDRGLHAAWLGHSTVLLRVDGFTILTDPVLGDRVGLALGPLTLGLKRLVAPALPAEQLPPIDLILLSHAHMDHFDIPTLRALEDRRVPVVTARNTSDLLRVEGYREVRELGWDERTRVGPVDLRAFKVNHWGARMRTDTHRGYNGYEIAVGRYRILFAGDTAYSPDFRALRKRKPFDLAIVPIGAYDPWIRYHCNPEQAWHMGNDAGAEFFLPVHHQTFQLSREPFFEPIERFLVAARNESSRVVVTGIGGDLKI
jgi:L-ascorbate metabolism protein UlaG (beta-lactamase superfamily)